MRIDVVTLFPQMVQDYARHGVLARALAQKLMFLHTWNPRDYSDNKQQQVDDRPYGGGSGMVMMAKPLQQAIRAARAQQSPACRVIYMNPQGKPLKQDAINSMARADGLILIAGRYKGIDERVVECEVDEQWSLGDYVISGGELAAMVVIEAVSRHIPQVLGNEDSAQEDSFMTGLLDCPHYTRPCEFEEQRVPEVLLSGDHESIRRWRLKQSLGRTLQQRPDLLSQHVLNREERELLNAYAREHGLVLTRMKDHENE